MEEENPQLKERLLAKKESLSLEKKESSKDAASCFFDKLSLRRYQLSPYTLQYFSKNINILKKKASTFLMIIDKIIKNEGEDIQDILKGLDIELASNGYIHYVDAIRLLKPTVFNIWQLHKITNMANSLDTYLSFSISKDYIYRLGLNEQDLSSLDGFCTSNILWKFKSD